MAGSAPRVKKMTTGEDQRDADPDGAPDRGFLELDDVRAAVGEQVDGQHDEDDGAEGGPGPEWNGHGVILVERWQARGVRRRRAPTTPAVPAPSLPIHGNVLTKITALNLPNIGN